MQTWSGRSLRGRTRIFFLMLILIWGLNTTQAGVYDESASGDLYVGIHRGNGVNFLTVWDAQSNVLSRERRSFREELPVNMQFFNEDRRILTGDHRGDLIVYDTSTFEVSETIEAHFGGINSLVVNANRTLAATASDDNQVKLWSLPNVREQSSISVNDQPLRVALNDDASRLAVITQNGSVRIFNTGNQREVASFQHQFSGQSASAIRSLGLDFFDQGRKLMSAAEPAIHAPTPSAHIFELNQGRITQSVQLSKQSTRNNPAVIVENGRFVLINNRLIEVETGTAYTDSLQLRNPTVSRVNSDLISTPSSNAGRGGFIRVSTNLMHKAGEFSGPLNDINALAFTPDGKHLVSVNKNPNVDRPLHIWEVETSRVVREVREGGGYLGFTSVTVSPNGQLIAFHNSETRKVEVRSFDNFEKVAEFNAQRLTRSVDRVAFTPDSSKLLITDGATPRLYEVETQRQIRPFNLPNNARSLRQLLIMDSEHLIVDGGDEVYYWNAGQRDPIYSLPTWRADIAASKQANRIAIPVFRGIRLHRLDTGEEVGLISQDQLQPAGTDGSSVVFSPNGKLLALKHLRHITVIDVVQQKTLCHFHLDRFTDELIFSPDSKYLAYTNSSGNTAYRIKMCDKAL